MIVSGYWNNRAGITAFDAGTGTITFTGNNTSTGIQNNETFYDLNISNIASSADNFKIFPGITLNVTDNLMIMAGTVNLQALSTLIAGNDLTINDGGKLIINPDAKLEIVDTKSVTVNTGGILELTGTSGHNAKVTHASGYYAVNIEAACTLSAEYATFEYMDGSGVNIKTGALLDATHTLHYCTYQLGEASGTLLTINNNQDLTINGAVFPDNDWSGTSNVTKSLDQGSVIFSPVSGGFSGAAYEDDAYNLISWGTSLPELQIMIFTAGFTSGYVCDPLNYNVSVKNNSGVNITVPFNVGLYYNSTGIPAFGDTPDQTINISSLAAGATVILTFPVTSSPVSGIWNSYLKVDTGNSVSESNESNNMSDPIVITWMPLPEVQAPAVTYNQTGNRIFLNWSYPASVSYFQVFRSANPLGPFTTVIASPTVNMYSETVTGTKYFYLVTAVKNWP